MTESWVTPARLFPYYARLNRASDFFRVRIPVDGWLDHAQPLEADVQVKAFLFYLVSAAFSCIAAESSKRTLVHPGAGVEATALIQTALDSDASEVVIATHNAAQGFENHFNRLRATSRPIELRFEHCLFLP